VIPSEEEALALHRKYRSNEAIVRHCIKVAEVAVLLAEGLAHAGKNVDGRAVLAGALLHDIGRTRIQTVAHGAEGAEILAGEGVDDEVVQIVRRHVGAGISTEEAKRLGLPDYDYIPRTLEERTVCFADKLVSTERIRPFNEEENRFLRKGHDVERLRDLKRELQKDLGQDPEKLVLDNIKESTQAVPSCGSMHLQDL
jgi:uncharacterized protein (TIGR00295 family)